MTNCRNCNFTINEENNYCSQCGAQVIKDRITLKSLFSNLLIALGWDSNFVVTLRYLVYKPQVVIEEYLNGTRKKFANPFSLFAIITALSLFAFSQYSNQYRLMSKNLGPEQIEKSEKPIHDINKNKDVPIFGYKNQDDFNNSFLDITLKYFNILAFLFLPIYTFIARITFGKPYNFGEHLVINIYLQSILSFLGLLLFILSLTIGVNLYFSFIMLLPILYYCYTYKKLYRLTFGQLLLKFLKFVVIFLLLFLIPVLIGIFLTLE
ncbi:DUF3667 domain-containing protein [Zobellia roscoffensis]|uniref:DUF3667 domain-containing protein n=1 Tax=Zobellia roscoffensis TaxID=2779508 RepID=UPI00188CF872